MITKDEQWYALQVRSNTEKLTNQVLLEKGYETFFPIRRSARRWSDRRKVIDETLFPGYLFCKFSLQRRQPIVTLSWVVRLVGFGGEPYPVEPQELESVRTVMASELHAKPWAALNVGQRVEIVEGPLRGVEGVLQQFRGGHRVVVTVSLIQRAIAVEVEAGWVSKAFKA